MLTAKAIIILLWHTQSLRAQTSQQATISGLVWFHRILMSILAATVWFMSSVAKQLAVTTTLYCLLVLHVHQVWFYWHNIPIVCSKCNETSNWTIYQPLFQVKSCQLVTDSLRNHPFTVTDSIISFYSPFLIHCKMMHLSYFDAALKSFINL